MGGELTVVEEQVRYPADDWTHAILLGEHGMAVPAFDHALHERHGSGEPKLRDEVGHIRGRQLQLVTQQEDALQAIARDVADRPIQELQLCVWGASSLITT